VAGVVNVITRRNLDGGRAEVQGMTTSRFDHQSFTGSLALGSVSDKASVQLGASVLLMNSLLNPERDYTNRNLLNTSRVGNPPTYIAQVGDMMTSVTVPDPNCGGSGAWSDPNSFLAMTPTGTYCTFNFNDYLTLVSEREQVNVMATADYDLTDDVRFVAEALFNRSAQVSMLPPSYPLTQTPVYTWGMGPAPADFDRVLNQSVAAAAALGMVSPLDTNGDGVHDATGLRLSGRPAGSNFPMRESPTRTDTFELRAGVRGDLRGVLENAGWSLSGGYAMSDFQLRVSDALVDRVASAPLACPAQIGGMATTPAQRLAAGCANFTSTGRLDYIAGTFGTAPGRADWADYLNAGGRFAGMAAGLPTPYTPEVHERLHGEEILDIVSTMTDVDAEFHGALLRLPGGDLSFAVGGQYRHETRRSTYDDDSYTGNLAFVGPNVANQNARDVWGAYAELAIPALRGVELSLAGRYDLYSGVGGGAFSPKAGLVLNVGDMAGFERDQRLLVRASASRSFRAPDLFQTAPQCASNIQNLNAGGSTTYRTVRFCGSSELGNETGDALNASVETQFGPLDVLAGMWWIQYSDLIVSESAVAILNACQAAGTCTSPAFTQPQAALQGQPRLTFADPTQVSTLSQIATSYQNSGEVKVYGLEFTGGYNADLGDAGNARLGVTGSYLLSYMRSALSVDPTTGASTLGGQVEHAGSRNFVSPTAPQPRLKLRVPLSWSVGPHALVVTGNYVSGMDDDENPIRDAAGMPTGLNTQVEPWLTLDLVYSLTLRASKELVTNVQVGARNLLDADPPWVNTTNGFEWVVHDPRGMMLFATLGQSF
jgi:iron complex outermembrane receptor protein